MARGAARNITKRGGCAVRSLGFAEAQHAQQARTAVGSWSRGRGARTLRHAIASLSVCICDARSERRMAMCLANCIAQPISGMRRISIFETYLWTGWGGWLHFQGSRATPPCAVQLLRGVRWWRGDGALEAPPEVARQGKNVEERAVVGRVEDGLVVRRQVLDALDRNARPHRDQREARPRLHNPVVVAAAFFVDKDRGDGDANQRRVDDER
eukprot:167927-Prymnesium_polylepis.2